jgi:hypothetical protein
MAEGVGFEPTELSLNGFQDRRLKPLGHPSWKRYGVLASRYARVNIFMEGLFEVSLFRIHQNLSLSLNMKPGH